MYLNSGYFPELAFGTYEEFILGYKPYIANDTGKMKLSQSFASHSHQASVRCIAAKGRYLVSSGADEYINVYDMLLKEVLTVINFHNSTVTCLEFVPDGSHLISANQNGDIAIFKCKDWSLVKYWKEAHKGSNGVLSISVHPSGGLLISAGADNIVRFWNLIKGRQAYAVNLSKKCILGKIAELYNTESAAVIYNFECPSKISSVDFSTADILLVGLESGVIQIHNLKKRKLTHEAECHKTRVKCLTTFEVPSSNEEGCRRMKYFVSADSRGLIKLWRLRIKKSVYSLLLKAQVDADCRITCISAIKPEVKEEL